MTPQASIIPVRYEQAKTAGITLIIIYVPMLIASIKPLPTM